MISNFFRIQKNKTFNYTPRYYDERKEKLQERIRQIELEMGMKKDGDYKPSISKGSIRGQIKKNARRADKKSNIRLFIILIVLFALAYILFFK